MSFLGNIIWVIFGGIFIFFQYIFGGLVLCLTIVGIPFGIQCFKFAIVGLAPFGVRISDTSSNTGCLSTIMNIIWLVFGGNAKIEGNTIKFGELMGTMMFCEDVGQAEGKYNEGLR
ncbi:MAG: META domain-containing protein, partial [Flavobacterium sp.]